MTPTPEGLRKKYETHDRAAALAAKAIAAIGGKESEALKAQLSHYKEATQAARKVSTQFEEVYKPVTNKEIEAASLIQELKSLYDRVKPAFGPLEELRTKAEAYDRTVDALKRDAGNDLKGISPYDPRLERLKAAKPRLEELSRQLEPYTADLKRLSEIETQLQQLSKARQDEAPRIKVTAEALEKADRDLEDQYFLLANAVAKTSGGRFPELQTFFRDESKRLERSERDETAATSDEQNACDKAMVDGTVSYLNANRSRTIVLVVGSHHLKNVARLLTAKGLPLIAAHLNANDRDIQPWEIAAWNRRKQALDRIYSREDGKKLKEISRLLNPLWKEEQTARFEVFRRFEPQAPDRLMPTVKGLIHDGVVYENVLPSRDVAVHVSRFKPDRNADYGAHIVDFGPDPSAPGLYFTTFDRAKAGKIVAEKSREGIVFSYFYKTVVSGKPTYQVVTPSGKVSLPEFRANLPKAKDGAPTTRVVLFGEPDVVQENAAVAAEPFWRSLRDPERIPLAQGNGAGNGGKKPPTNVAGGGFGEPPGNGRGSGKGGDSIPKREWSRLLLIAEAEEPTPVYRTNNTERAWENLKALDQQKSEFLSEIRYYEAGQLDELPFTPSRGDNAQVVMIVARNVEEFLSEIARAAESRKLQNKQVALVTCGGAFPETANLREQILQSGSVMVWTPDRQVSPAGADRLKAYVQKVEQSPGQRPSTIEGVINKRSNSGSRTARATPICKPSSAAQPGCGTSRAMTGAARFEGYPRDLERVPRSTTVRPVGPAPIARWISACPDHRSRGNGLASATRDGSGKWRRPARRAG